MIEVIYNDIQLSECAFYYGGTNDSRRRCRFYDDGPHVINQSKELNEMRMNKTSLKEDVGDIFLRKTGDLILLEVKNEWVDAIVRIPPQSCIPSVVRWNELYCEIAHKGGVQSLLDIIQEYDWPSVTQLAYASFVDAYMLKQNSAEGGGLRRFIKEVRFEPSIDVVLDSIGLFK